MREQILELASRPQGVTENELRELTTNDPTRIKGQQYVEMASRMSQTGELKHSFGSGKRPISTFTL